MPEADIHFGEIETPPVGQGVRPDEDPGTAVVRCGEPSPDDVRIFIADEPYADIQTHAESDTTVELGGVLLGHRLSDAAGRPFVVVLESLRAKHYESTLSRFTYTHDTWREITKEKDDLHPDLEIVGWYHTHPGWGIFLSGHDEFIHRNWFGGPLDVAYVVDPVNDERGWFAWRATEGGGRELPELDGCYVFAPRGRRASLEHTVARIEGKRSWEPSSERPAWTGPGPGGPILGRGALTGAVALLCCLAALQLLVSLAGFGRPADPAAAAAKEAEQKKIAAEIDELRKKLDKHESLDRKELRLAAREDLLRVLESGVQVDGRSMHDQLKRLGEDVVAARRDADALRTQLSLVTEASAARDKELVALRGADEKAKKLAADLEAERAKHKADGKAGEGKTGEGGPTTTDDILAWLPTMGLVLFGLVGWFLALRNRPGAAGEGVDETGGPLRVVRTGATTGGPTGEAGKPVTADATGTGAAAGGAGATGPAGNGNPPAKSADGSGPAGPGEMRIE